MILPILKKALTGYEDILLKNMVESIKKQLDIKTLIKSYMKASFIIDEIEDESKKLPAVKKFFR